VGTSKILARYKGSTISLQAAAHLGHRPRALVTKTTKKKPDTTETDVGEDWKRLFVSQKVKQPKLEANTALYLQSSVVSLTKYWHTITFYYVFVKM
jgi:hypothetical protein